MILTRLMMIRAELLTSRVQQHTLRVVGQWRYKHHRNVIHGHHLTLHHLPSELEKFKINDQDIVETHWVEPQIDINKYQLDQLEEKVKNTPLNLNVVSYKSKPAPIAELPSVVFLHGLFGSSLNFRSVGKVISKNTGHATHGIDLRCHGESPKFGPLSYLQMVDDVIKTLEEHDLQDIILVGHSMGAKVAMLLALVRPDLVSKLVVVDNSPVSAPLSKRFYLGLIGLVEVELNKELDKHHHSFKNYFHHADRILAKYEPSKLTRLFLLSNLVHHKGQPKLKTLVLQFLKQESLKQVEQWPQDAVQGKIFNKPTKVMRGIESEFISDKNIKHDFPIYFPDIEFEDYNTGHWLISNQPKKFIKSMEDFINK